MERRCLGTLTLVFALCFIGAVALTSFALRIYQSTDEAESGRGVFFAGFLFALLLSTSLGFLFLAAFSRLLCVSRTVEEEPKEALALAINYE